MDTGGALLEALDAQPLPLAPFAVVVGEKRAGEDGCSPGRGHHGVIDSTGDHAPLGVFDVGLCGVEIRGGTWGKRQPDSGVLGAEAVGMEAHLDQTGPHLGQDAAQGAHPMGGQLFLPQHIGQLLTANRTALEGEVREHQLGLSTLHDVPRAIRRRHRHVAAHLESDARLRPLSHVRGSPPVVPSTHRRPRRHPTHGSRPIMVPRRVAPGTSRARIRALRHRSPTGGEEASPPVCDHPAQLPGSPRSRDPMYP